MTAPKSVEVVIGGLKLTISSEHSPEYTAEVAAHFDRAFQKIRSALPTVDAHRAAILAGLAVTDELFQARLSAAAGDQRVAAVTERLARLVSPKEQEPRP